MPDESADVLVTVQAQQRRAISQFLRSLTWLIAAGVLLRLTVRDALPVVAVLFYALPLPVLLGLATLRTGGAGLWQPRRSAWMWVGITSLLAVWCVTANYRRHVPETAPRSLRVLCWNAARAEGGWNDEVADVVRSEQPDIVALIEAGGWIEDLQEFWAAHCPEYEQVILDGAMLCLIRVRPGLSVGQGTSFPLSTGGSAGQVDILWDDAPLAVVLVDIKSNPLRHRADPLAALARYVDALADRPVMVLGDFNTPPESVHFRPLRVLHQEAFETVGDGYAPTWPLPIPVLHLDQVWTNRHVRLLHCIRRGTVQSDHRPVVAEITLTPSD
ncbi:MAG: endonuclease/exonuclease/phosphatase family protein [Planctomycetaceae bacterium]|nr:endonuclease/exonuclease/phosphatase family protein [Planctomycetaceae bacterium]